MFARNYVIFDMDGVIIDSEPLHFAVERTLFAELGLPVGETEHAGFVGCSSRTMWETLRSRYGLDRQTADLVLYERRRYREALQAEGVPFMPGMVDLIRELASGGVAVAIASSAPHEQIDEVVRTGALASAVRVRVSGDDVPHSKPDPAIFLRAATLMGADPYACTVVEDSEHGVSAARAAGMRCIGFRNPNSGAQNLSRADAVVDGVEELRALLFERQFAAAR